MAIFMMLTLLTAFAVWRVRRQDRVSVRRRPGCARKPRKLAAFLLTVAVLGLQMIVTAPPASAAGCGEAPYPERTGMGMVGELDPTVNQGLPESPYYYYGYAGQVWYTYQTDCGPLSGVLNTSSTLDTWAGNQFFNVAKVVIGATNGLHYLITENAILYPLTNAVKAGADKVYNNIYGQIFGLVAILLAIVMFVNILRGDLAKVSKRGLYLLAAMWLAASSFTVMRFMDPLDKAILDTTRNISTGFVSSPDDVVRDVIPTLLHKEVVYKNWLKGEFGSLIGHQDEDFGMRLLDAQAFTTVQTRDGIDKEQSVVDAKKAEYKSIAGQLGPATKSFTGEAGGRTGTGFLALVQSLIFALFQMVSKLAILLAEVLIRLFVLTAPLIGLVAMLHNQVLHKVAKTAGVVAFNMFLLAVLAGVHVLLLQAIFNEKLNMDVLPQMALGLLITALLFIVGRPFRRLGQMIQTPVKEFGGNLSMPGSRVFSRLKRRNPEESGQTPQDRFYESLGSTQDQMGAATGGGRFRPEAAATVNAKAQRVVSKSSSSRPFVQGNVVEGQVISSSTDRRRTLPASADGVAEPAFVRTVTGYLRRGNQPPVVEKVPDGLVVASQLDRDDRRAQTAGTGAPKVTKSVVARRIDPDRK